MYYLKGLKAVKIYKIVYIIFIAIGPFMSLEFIFVLADIVNGCMAIPSNWINWFKKKKLLQKQQNILNMDNCRIGYKYRRIAGYPFL